MQYRNGKWLGLLLAMLMLVSLLPVAALADEGEEPVGELVGEEVVEEKIADEEDDLAAFALEGEGEGTTPLDYGMTPGYTTQNGDNVRIYGEATVKPSTSLYLKLYSGSTLLATTTLNKLAELFSTSTPLLITWNFYQNDTTDEYWTTVWETGHPNDAYQPTTVKLYEDGECVATSEVQMNRPDSTFPVTWNALKGVTILPKGDTTPGYVEDTSFDEVRVWGEATANPTSSLVLKLYSGSTRIATTEFIGNKDIFAGGARQTWSFYLTRESGSWKTTWAEGHPNDGAQPDKVELYVDGVLVDTEGVEMNAPDDQNPVAWNGLKGVTILPKEDPQPTTQPTAQPTAAPTATPAASTATTATPAPSAKPVEKGAPKTGDEADLALWLVLATVSAAAVAIVASRKKVK